MLSRIIADRLEFQRTVYLEIIVDCIFTNDQLVVPMLINFHACMYVVCVRGAAAYLTRCTSHNIREVEN